MFMGALKSLNIFLGIWKDMHIYRALCILRKDLNMSYSLTSG